jgi:hypothetical protein
VDELGDAARRGDVAAVRALLCEVVPEYQPDGVAGPDAVRVRRADAGHVLAGPHSPGGAPDWSSAGSAFPAPAAPGP